MAELPVDLWWAAVVGALVIAVIVGGLLLTMIIAYRRQARLHQAYTQRLLEVHEEERTRVAREVHDDAVQRLGLLKHELSTLKDGATDRQTRRVDGITAEVDDLAQALRQLAHRLHPSVIDHGGLWPALTQLREEVARAHGLEVTLEFPDPAPALPRDTALTLFRIAQESLRNVSRHAGVNEAELNAEVTDGILEFTIRDAGKGFDPGLGKRGLGLVGMQERARLVDGTVSLRSGVGKGTAVTVRVPLAAEPT